MIVITSARSTCTADQSYVLLKVLLISRTYWHLTGWQPEKELAVAKAADLEEDMVNMRDDMVCGYTYIVRCMIAVYGG